MADKYYYYKDKEGNPIFRVKRVTKASGENYCFTQYQQPDGRWVKGMGDVKFHPLYRPPKSDSNYGMHIVMVDNEEEADYLNSFGLLATCLPANQKIIRKDYIISLSKFNKIVVILLSPDAVQHLDFYKRFAARMLHGIDDVKVPEVKLIELPHSILAITEEKNLRGDNTMDAETLIEMIKKAHPINFDKLDFQSQTELMEEAATFLNDVKMEDTDSYLNALKEISNFPTYGQRKYFIRHLTRKMGMAFEDIEADFIKYHGSLEPKPTYYVQGIIDVVDYIDANCFLACSRGSLYADSTVKANDNQTYIASSKETTEIPIYDFYSIEKYYLEARKQFRHRIQPLRFEPSAFEKALFLDLKSYFSTMTDVGENYLELVVYFIFLTYIHDYEGINQLPFLHLLFPSAKTIEDFNPEALSYITFRGIIQNYLNEHHIVRLTDSYAATIVFKIMDFEKTVKRYNLYDLLISRYRRDGSRRFHITYNDFKEEFTARYTFSPTIIVSTKPFADELLQSISLSIPISINKDYRRNEDKDLPERLRAWRATILGEIAFHLPRIQEEEFPEIMNPLLQICIMINPEGMETLKNTLRILKPKSQQEKMVESMAGVLIEQYPKYGPPSHDYGTVDTITELVNKHLQADLSATQVGRILNRELSLKTQKVHPGNMHLIVTMEDLKNIKHRFKIRTPVTTKFDEMVHEAAKIIKENRDRNISKKKEVVC